MEWRNEEKEQTSGGDAGDLVEAWETGGDFLGREIEENLKFGSGVPVLSSPGKFKHNLFLKICTLYIYTQKCNTNVIKNKKLIS